MITVGHTQGSAPGPRPVLLGDGNGNNERIQVEDIALLEKERSRVQQGELYTCNTQDLAVGLSWSSPLEPAPPRVQKGKETKNYHPRHKRFVYLQAMFTKNKNMKKCS